VVLRHDFAVAALGTPLQDADGLVLLGDVAIPSTASPRSDLMGMCARTWPPSWPRLSPW
jgi:hypothetical protein